MQKAALRREMLQKRQACLPGHIAARSQQICQRFFDYFSVKNLQTIHVFLPIATKKEVNTWLIVETLRAYFPEIAIAVPVTDCSNQTLTHHLLPPGAALQLNRWGIPEPHGTGLIAEQAMDMVLVPLLAFDEKGHRVGYGKGFYDCFLALCRPDTLIIGLSLEEEPVPLISDVHEADISLQFVVTPTRVYPFPKNK